MNIFLYEHDHGEYISLVNIFLYKHDPAELPSCPGKQCRVKRWTALGNLFPNYQDITGDITSSTFPSPHIHAFYKPYPSPCTMHAQRFQLQKIRFQHVNNFPSLD